MTTDKIKTIIRNKKAYHDYFVEQSLEAGIALTGTEVKSLRQGKVNLLDAYAEVRRGEVWLIGSHINEYTHGNRENHDPMRERKLLLNRNEIRKLDAKVKEKGFTLVPLSLYFKNGKVKVELGLVRGKKLYDKRDTIAKKDFLRDQDRQHSIKY
ncbi:MAG: SsrA-binding protein SmpB [Ignavibacteriaceae bacterium]|nr:SsrA-binding protein SmpB [Ignavibacteriaceae bacterium]NUM69834.1 SsrA-binding protein SmpB [Ignavibacteriaceae bacterium]